MYNKDIYQKCGISFLKKAYDDNYDYFYQCGDDIQFNDSKQIFDLIIENLKKKII